MKANTGKLPQARHAELFVEEIGDDLLVYDADRRSAHRLNAMAAWVWRHCDGKTTVAQATQLLSAELQHPVEEELIWLSLETLENAQLLLTPVKRREAATEESRRALFQRMAVAGAVLLLPVITPLTQPAAAQGESTQPLTVKVGAIPALKFREAAITGVAEKDIGIYGWSQKWHGVQGYSDTTKEANAAGVKGTTNDGVGVMGTSKTGRGLWGFSGTGPGAYCESDTSYGVHARTSTGTALYAEYLGKGSGRAGFFKGDVEVTGDIRLTNADCAEDFDIVDAENIDPGAVMVLSPEGGLQLSDRAYDKRVAGVISGAGDYKPGLILDQRATGNPRKPVALMGKVFCKVDAKFGSIEIGDLLTTSDTPGHAMKASDSGKAFGSVLGKALKPWSQGEGLIPILVTLQ
jgi:hypothetical protein